jgi:hypothetical protein
MMLAPFRKKRVSRTRQAFGLDGSAGGPVLIPYARFLECRARRLQIAAELTPPDGQRPIDAASSVPIANDEPVSVAVGVLAPGSVAGVQQS